MLYWHINSARSQTTIDASAVAPGTPISSIGSGINFDKHRGGAVNSIKLSDGTVTFGAATTTKAVSFNAPTPTSAIWTSNPTLLANPGSNSYRYVNIDLPK